MIIIRYCFNVLKYQNKIQKSIIILWTIALLLPVLQFSNFTKMSQAGTVETSFFLVSLESLPLMLVLYAIPLFAGLLYGDIYIEQRKFKDYIIMRVNLKKLHWGNTLVSFLSGFLLCLFFLLLTFAITYFILNDQSTIVEGINFLGNPRFVSNVMKVTTFPILSINYPIVRIFIYIILISLYAGFCSIIAYTISLFTTNKAVAFITPFFVTMSLQIIASFFDSILYFQSLINPITYVVKHFETVLITYFACCFIILAIVGFIGLKMEGRK